MRLLLLLELDALLQPLERLRLELELLAAGALPLERLRLELLLAAGAELLPEDERERVTEPLLAVDGLLPEDDLTLELPLLLLPEDDPRTALLPLERLLLVGL